MQCSLVGCIPQVTFSKPSKKLPGPPCSKKIAPQNLWSGHALSIKWQTRPGSWTPFCTKATSSGLKLCIYLSSVGCAVHEMRAEQTDRNTDRQTDGRTVWVYKRYIMGLSVCMDRACGLLLLCGPKPTVQICLKSLYGTVCMEFTTDKPILRRHLADLGSRRNISRHFCVRSWSRDRLDQSVSGILIATVAILSMWSRGAKVREIHVMYIISGKILSSNYTSIVQEITRMPIGQIWLP